MYYVKDASELATRFPQWPNLRSIGFRQVKGKAPQLGYRYYISSAELSEKALAEAVRAHWSIENSLHWVLDVTLGEDQCQIHHQNGAENWAMLRRLSLNMLRAEP